MSTGYVREVVALAESLGFHLVEGCTGSGHLLLEHPNGKVTLSSTPSEHRGRKNAIATLERVAGKRLPKANHRRSRKSVKPSGYNPLAAAREGQAWHREHDATVADLLARRDTLVAECRQYAQDRGRLRDIPAHLEAIARIERQLAHMAQPVQPFDPYTLAPR